MNQPCVCCGTTKGVWVKLNALKSVCWDCWQNEIQPKRKERWDAKTARADYLLANHYHLKEVQAQIKDARDTLRTLQADIRAAEQRKKELAEEPHNISF